MARDKKEPREGEMGAQGGAVPKPGETDNKRLKAYVDEEIETS